MRAVIQRVDSASVVIGGVEVSSIGAGLLVYLGIENGDGETDAAYIADKTRFLRIFPDAGNAINRDVVEAGGSVLVVSAFTTAADARRGRRPSFDSAAASEQAEPLYERVCTLLAGAGLVVERGRFGADMRIVSGNDGPICILIDSARRF